MNVQPGLDCNYATARTMVQFAGRLNKSIARFPGGSST
jgi:hypothetical protein